VKKNWNLSAEGKKRGGGEGGNLREKNRLALWGGVEGVMNIDCGGGGKRPGEEKGNRP